MNKFTKIILQSMLIISASTIGLKSTELRAFNRHNVKQKTQKFNNYFTINSNTNDNLIVNKGAVYLSTDFNKYKQADGSFKFEGSKTNIDQYNYIEGSKDNDVVILNGKLSIGSIDLLTGNNTLNIQAKSNILLGSNGFNIKHINTLNIKEGVHIDNLNAYYGDNDITINFNGSNPQDASENIVVGKLSLNSNTTSHSVTINIVNTTLVLQDGIVISAGNNNINLGENSQLSSINKDIILNGSNTFKMGENSIIKGNITFNNGNNSIRMQDNTTIDGNIFFNNGNSFIETGHSSLLQNIKFGNGNNTFILQTNTQSKNITFGDGNNTLTLNTGTHSEGDVVFGDGNNTIQTNIVDNQLENKTSVITGNTIFTSGFNKVHVVFDSTLNIQGSLTSNGGNTNIQVDKRGKLILGKKILLSGKGNNISAQEGAIIDADIKFDKNSSDNNIIIDTESSAGKESVVKILGSLEGSNNNDSLTVLGSGKLLIDNSNSKKEAMNGFDNINLGSGALEIKGSYEQTDDVNINISVGKNNTIENEARIHITSDTNFNEHDINLTYDKVSENLNKVGDKYELDLIELDKGLEDINKIGIRKINFESAIYEIQYKNENKNTLHATLTKTSTFKDALSGKNNQPTANDNILKMAEYFDNLIEKGNLPKEYYKLLDSLSMMNLSKLNNTLEIGVMPIMGITLFNINKYTIDNFNNMLFNNKIHRIENRGTAIWYNYNYSRVVLDNIKGAKGAKSTGNMLAAGIEYDVSSSMKIGIDAGYANIDINGNDNVYEGYSNNMYYGIYGVDNITNNLILNANITFLNANYNLKRKFDVNHISSEPKIFQSNIDLLLSYKFNLGAFHLIPFASFGYTYGVIDEYKEEGVMSYNVDKDNFKEISGGVGLKANMIEKIGNHIIIPNISLAIKETSQDIDDTIAHYGKVNDMPATTMAFKSGDYSGLSGIGSIGISYILHNNTALDFNIGTSIGNKNTAYNLSLVLNIPL